MIQNLIFPKLPSAYEVLTRKDVIQCISQNSFYIKRRWNRQVIQIDQLRGQLPRLKLPSPMLLAHHTPPPHPHTLSLDNFKSLLLFCSFKSHKYINYVKAAYIVVSYPQSIHLLPGQTNSPASPSTNQRIPFKLYVTSNPESDQ